MSGWKKVFETTDTETGDLTHRIKVQGGYLYRNIFILAGTHNVSMTFVPCNFGESGTEETEEEITRIEKLIYQGVQTHASILQCKADLKKVDEECQRLSKYIAECDQARFNNNNKIYDRLDNLDDKISNLIKGLET